MGVAVSKLDCCLLCVFGHSCEEEQCKEEQLRPEERDGNSSLVSSDTSDKNAHDDRNDQVDLETSRDETRMIGSLQEEIDWVEREV